MPVSQQCWGEVDFFLLHCFLSMVLLRRSVEIILEVNIFQRYKSFPDLTCACYSRYSLEGLFCLYLFLRLRQPGNYLICGEQGNLFSLTVVGAGTPAFCLTDWALVGCGYLLVRWKGTRSSKEVVGLHLFNVSLDYSHLNENVNLALVSSL